MNHNKHDWERAKYWDSWARLIRLQEEMQAIWNRVCQLADREYDPFTSQGQFDFLDLVDYLEGRFDGIGVFDHITQGRLRRMRGIWASFKEREGLEREMIQRMRQSKYKFRPK